VYTHAHVHTLRCADTAGVVEGLKMQLKGLQPQLTAKAVEADSLLKALAVEQKEALAAQVRQRLQSISIIHSLLNSSRSSSYRSSQRLQCKHW
jgi:hypothetical protein